VTVTVGYSRQAPPAPAEAISRLEAKTGKPLPAAYQSYLRQQDGGRLEDNALAVSEVFGIGPDAPDWANLWRKLKTFSGRVPGWLLPVASDAFGNLFALSLRDNDYGSVWFWDHELEADEDEPATEDNLTYQAADWLTFLSSLKPLSSRAQ
jgi:hypothetical protein